MSDEIFTQLDDTVKIDYKDTCERIHSMKILVQMADKKICNNKLTSQQSKPSGLTTLKYSKLPSRIQRMNGTKNMITNGHVNVDKCLLQILTD